MFQFDGFTLNCGYSIELRGNFKDTETGHTTLLTIRFCVNLLPPLTK